MSIKPKFVVDNIGQTDYHSGQVFGKTEQHIGLNGERRDDMAFTLKALRVNAGMDQKQAAELLGITPETLGRWESAKTFPDAKQISKIEELYKVPYSEINFLLKDIG